jgi:hypothetical protein
MRNLVRTIGPVLAIGLIFGVGAGTGAAAGSSVPDATAEGFGGPYTAGSTDIGTAITYGVVFALLYLSDDLAGRSPWALDSRIEDRYPWWARVARTPRGSASAPTGTGA